MCPRKMLHFSNSFSLNESLIVLFEYISSMQSINVQCIHLFAVIIACRRFSKIFQSFRMVSCVIDLISLPYLDES